MELLERGAVPTPTLRTEEVPMASLGGKVIVRGRLLAQALALNTLHLEAAVVRDGETPSQAAERAGAEIVARTLAGQVLLGDGKPMWNAEQWSIHGAAHPEEVIALHHVAQRLSGAVAEDVAKN